jgi:four helix bundle protein
VTPEELRERLAAFARDVRVFAAALLPQPQARDVAIQLMRAASGAAANHRSARRGRSYAEFKSKLSVALEEADEAQFWLEHLRDCNLAPPSALGPLLAEATQLVAILAASCATTRTGARRP